MKQRPGHPSARIKKIQRVGTFLTQQDGRDSDGEGQEGAGVDVPAVELAVAGGNDGLHQQE